MKKSIPQMASDAMPNTRHRYTLNNLNMAGLFATVRTLADDERGQDLIEYTLLLAFVALASAGLFIGGGGSVCTIWSNANSTLSLGAS